MWAALLHDIGKATTTKVRKEKITAYDHDKVGETLAIRFLKEFSEDEAFINRIAMMVKWHMQPLFVAKDMPFADVEKMNEEISSSEIALLSICDRLGRGQMTPERIRSEMDSIERFRKKADIKK